MNGGVFYLQSGWNFLSCLLGSERLRWQNPADSDFLSCLLGSEPVRNTALSADMLSELPTRQ